MGVAASLKSFGHRRVVTPLIAQLKQGSSPDELASSLAWGGAIALFPIMGTTTFLCAVVGQLRKLNHVALQLMNYILFPLHLAVIVPFLKLGDWAFQVRPIGYSFAVMLREFENSPLGFGRHYGGAALRACVVWMVVMPLPALLFRAAIVPWLRRLAAKIKTFHEKH
jgi:uncharacterized protein (DUF2062 family)